MLHQMGGWLPCDLQPCSKLEQLLQLLQVQLLHPGRARRLQQVRACLRSWVRIELKGGQEALAALRLVINKR